MDKIAKRKDGLILIIVLWIMFFLSVAVLTLGANNRMNIRLRSLNNESLRMFYLAKEGVNRAIDSLISDDQEFDSLNENWSKKISLEKDEGIVTVQIIDENRFININSVSGEILNNIKLLFPEITAEQIDAIMKNRPFNLKTEVKDLLEQGEIAPLVEQTGLIDMLTTFTDGTLNINTASEKVLALIPNMTEAAAQTIISHRQANPFISNDSLSAELSLLGLPLAQISSLIKFVKVRSAVFRILVKAQSKDRYIAKKLEVVVSRQEQKIRVLSSMEN
ncbi:MAG: type II secretion system protein GspK [Candidatus Omnitrophota bacterium]